MDWHLLPERAAFLPVYNVLLLADLHLGKAGHFRKNGIPVSGQVHQEDILRLEQLMIVSQAKTIVFLGDLFHSDANNEWFDFVDLLHRHSQQDFILVKGNHDILPKDFYQIKNLDVMDMWKAGPFSFTHQHQADTDGYNISGHVHPGVKLGGTGKQHMTLPCFYFSDNHALMPAFGFFTGLYAIKVKRTDQVFGVLDNVVHKLN